MLSGESVRFSVALTRRTPAFFQSVLVVCTVVAVAGKAVELVDNYGFEGTLLCISYHLQELMPLFGVLAGRGRAIYISSYYRNAMPLTVVKAYSLLTLNGLFRLRAARISEIEAGFYNVRHNDLDIKFRFFLYVIIDFATIQLYTICERNNL